LYIKYLQLTQFRNYNELSLAFNASINCISGPNGSGKTNILDALHYLAFTRGFRSNQDKQAIQEGETFFFNQMLLHKHEREQKIQCNFIKGKGKKVLIGQHPLKKMSEHIGSVPMVAVLPNDTDLINGPSALRRKFVDMLISQYDHSYLQHLIQYERVISQRNALLKLFVERGGFDKDELELWNFQLIPAAMYIHQLRTKFSEEFLPIFRHYFKRIVSERETPTIRYRSVTKDNTYEGWEQLLQEQQMKDRVMQYTTNGIHRDDLIFSINDQSVRNFGSQGQQKTFIIALKLAQYQLLEQHTQIAPILLLDDIFDKLDEHRLGAIAKILDQEIKGQIFITDTSHERLAAIFKGVEKGQLAFFEVMHGVAKRLV